MKTIKGKITRINGCGIAKSLSIEIESSDEIKIEEIIGKDVEVILLEDKPKQPTIAERTHDALCENHSPISSGEKAGRLDHRSDTDLATSPVDDALCESSEVEK